MNRITDFISGIIIRGTIATGIGIILELAFVFVGGILFRDSIDALVGTGIWGFLIFHLIGWVISFPLLNEEYSMKVAIPDHVITVRDGKNTMVARIYTD